MRRARPISRAVKDSLGRLLKESKSKWEFQRVQCVWMRAELGLGAEDIAKAVGWNPGYVRQVQARFLREGETSLKIVGRGGRYHENLSIEQEEKLLEPFLPGAQRGQVLVVSDIKAAYEARIGRKVPKSTVYRMLERHGWRKIAPRPHHPKTDPLAQEAFKKTSRR